MCSLLISLFPFRYLEFCEKENMNPLDPKFDLYKFLKTTKNFPDSVVKGALKALNLDHLIPKKPLNIKFNIKSEKFSASTSSSSLEKLPPKIDSDPYKLSSFDERLVTRCYKCGEKFNHATYLIYHLIAKHDLQPRDYISEVMGNTPQVMSCPRCMKKCLSPIVLALHHDRHMLQNKHIKCQDCRKNYVSPAVYYANDTCQSNGISENAKKEGDRIILETLRTDPKTKLLGTDSKKRSRSPSVEKTSRKSAAKRARISTSASGGGNDSDDAADFDYTPVESYDDIELEEDLDEISTSTENSSNHSGRSSRAFSRDSSVSRSRTSSRESVTSSVSGYSLNKSNQIDLERAKAWEKMVKPCSIVIKRRPAIEKKSTVLKSTVFPKPGPKSQKLAMKTEPSSPASPIKRSKPGPIKTEPSSPVSPIKRSRPGPKCMKDYKRKKSHVWSKKRMNRAVPKSKQIAKEILPIQVTSIKLKKSKDIHFCLDCENCRSKSCDHHNHTRKMVDRIDLHVQDYAHGRYQSLTDFFDGKKLNVSLNEVAYDSKHGVKVRKLYKRFASENEDNPNYNLFDYQKQKKCLSCDFETASIVYMFRHIREEHLKE